MLLAVSLVFHPDDTQTGCVCAQVRSEIVAWICQWVWQVSSKLSLIGANCIPSMLVSSQRECGCYYGEALEPVAISTFFCNQNTRPTTTKVWVSCWQSSPKARLSDLKWVEMVSGFRMILSKEWHIQIIILWRENCLSLCGPIAP